MIAVDGPNAVVDMIGRRRRASTLLLPDICVGEFVIVGAGSILRRLDAAEATNLIRALDAAIATTALRSNPDPGGRP